MILELHYTFKFLFFVIHRRRVLIRLAKADKALARYHIALINLSCLYFWSLVATILLLIIFLTLC